MRKTSVALLMLLALQAGPAWPQTGGAPMAGPGDPRIKEFYYDRDKVVSIEGQLGYEMMIEFNPDERIENVSIGDALAWQVSPNKKATLLFLKPMAASRPTSMTVVTSERVYSFVLSAQEKIDAAKQLLRLRFLYLPDPEPAPQAAPPPAAPARPQSQLQSQRIRALRAGERIRQRVVDLLPVRSGQGHAVDLLHRAGWR